MSPFDQLMHDVVLEFRLCEPSAAAILVEGVTF